MRRITPLLVWLQLLLICGCSSLDCPLNSTVYCRYVLAGPVTTLTDTLSVSTVPEGGSDPVVLNSYTDKSDFLLPISYVHPVDVLFFTSYPTSYNVPYCVLLFAQMQFLNGVAMPFSFAWKRNFGNLLSTNVQFT